MRRPIVLEVYKSGPWFKVSLLCLVYGAKLRERFPPGLRDTGPCKDSRKRADASMEEEDGGQSHVQNYVGNCLHQGKYGDAPEGKSEASISPTDPPDHLSQAGSEGPVLWRKELSHHCVRHRTHPHSISYCCHHQGGNQASLGNNLA